MWLAARNNGKSTREPCGAISISTSDRRRLRRRSLLPKHPPNGAQVAEKVHPAHCRDGRVSAWPCQVRRCAFSVCVPPSRSSFRFWRMTMNLCPSNCLILPCTDNRDGRRSGTGAAQRTDPASPPPACACMSARCSVGGGQCLRVCRRACARNWRAGVRSAGGHSYRDATAGGDALPRGAPCILHMHRHISMHPTRQFMRTCSTQCAQRLAPACTHRALLLAPLTWPAQTQACRS